jgi:hypothetical protein
MVNYYNSKDVECNFNSNFEESKKFDSMSTLTSLFGKFKCMAIIMFMMLTIGQLSWAQSTANYAFTTNTTGSLALDANANTVDMSSGTTQLVAADLDDSSSPVTNIGFHFYMYGNFFNQFSASSNGVIQLGSTPVGSATYALSGGSTTSPRIGALAADLRTGFSGKVHYKVVGTAPNRCLVIEFSNMSVTFVASPGSNDATYQVRLYESSGSIEYVYGSMFKNASTTTAAAIFSGFSVGTVLNTTASITTSTNTVSNLAAFNVNSYTASTNIANLHSTVDGSRRIYKFTPPIPAAGPTSLLVSGATSSGMTLNWTAASPTTNIVKYIVLNSTNGGATFNFVANVALGTNTYVASGLMPSTTYDWKVIAVSEGTESSSATGTLATTAAATYYWVGTTGGNWNTPANWNTAADNSGSTRAVVSSTDILIIDGDGTTAGGSTTINVDLASFTIGQLIINSNTNVTLQSNIATTRTISVSGALGDDFVIEAGSTLNLNNATNATAIAFSGTGNTGLISGTLNISGAAANTFNSTGGTGTLVTVAATGIINNSFLGATGVTGSVATLSFLDGSAYNVSGATTGAPNVPLATWATNSTLTISGLTTSTTGPTNNIQSFGNIVFNCPGSSATWNMFGATTTAVVKGNLTIQATGTGQFRTVSTGTLNVNGTIIVNSGATLSAHTSGSTIANGNTTINVGGTLRLDAGAGNFRQQGSTLTNNGTIIGTGSATAHNLFFLSFTDNPITFTGSGVVSPAINSITVQTLGGLTITHANQIPVLRVNLFYGNMTGSDKLTIGTGLALNCTVQVGSAGNINPAGILLSQPTWNLGTGVLNLLYAQGTLPYTTGFEVPPTRTANNVSLINTNGLTLSGGPLEVSGTLTLTAGNFTTSAANLLSLGTASAAGTLTGGSAASYINGPFARTIATANANTNYILYPVGKAAYAPVSLAPATTSISIMKAETFDSNSGSANVSIISLAANRRWETPLVSGTITDINVRLGDANLVNGNIPVQANLAAGQYTSTFGATATFAAGTPNTIQSNSTVSSANYTGFLSYAVTNACTGAQLITTSPNVAICNGDSTVLSVSSANDPNHNYTWSPATGLSSTSGASVTANPTVTTTYTVTANDIITGCITTGTIVVTVNTAPAAVVVTPATAAICSGAIQQLDASGGTYTAAVLSGSGASTTTGNVTSALLGPNPFQNFYGGTKQQWIYTAAELSALGFSAGTQINEIKLDLASANTTYALANLVVKMKNTATGSFASTTAWETSLTTVKAAASYTPVVGLNSFVLDAPFAWNGTSNLVIEMNYSNNNGGAAAYNTAKHSPTSFVSTIFYRADNQTAALVDAFVGTANFTYSSRNDITFVHTSIAPRTWSPLTDLYTDAAATIAYTGTSATTVYAKPTGNITYTATATLGTCLKSNTSVITVTASSTLPTETISACDSYTWSANGTVYTVGGIYTSTTACVTRTLDLTITPSSTLPTETISACDSYTWSANGTVYTVGGIYTSTTACVTRTLDLTITPSSSSPTETISACDSYTWSANGTVYTVGGIYTSTTACVTRTLDLTINTTSSLPTETISACDSYTWSANGTVYTVGGIYTSTTACVTRTLDLTITTATISGATAQVINGGVAADATIEDIVVTSNGTVTWFASSADATANTNPLPVGTQLVDGNIYYGVTNIGICRSTTLAVTVTVVLGNASFDLSQLNYYPNPVKDIFNVKYNKEIISVDVYDLTGRKVIEMKPNTLEVQLNMTNLSSAMYIVRLQSVDGITELKVYKN